MATQAENVSMLPIVQAFDDGEGFFRCCELRQRGPCAAAARHYRAPSNIAPIMHVRTQHGAMCSPRPLWMTCGGPPTENAFPESSKPRSLG